jgi:hypothetical protein
VRKTCEVCGSEYLTKPSHAARRRYCSRACFERAHSETMSGQGNPAWRHGQARRNEVTSEYHVWHHMMRRCCDRNDKRWDRYGGRGIKVCRRWHGFENFFEDMGRRPSGRHQIERSDNDKDYSPQNCVWALPLQQSRNRSSNINITYEGDRMCLKAWAERLSIPYATLYQRIRAGWPVPRAFAQVVRS